jgi:predicted S18 family serine protease
MPISSFLINADSVIVGVDGALNGHVAPGDGRFFVSTAPREAVF